MDKSIRTPRFPAPGSEPDDLNFNDPTASTHDYKTSFRDSKHNIRYRGPYAETEFKSLIHVFRFKIRTLWANLSKKN